MVDRYKMNNSILRWLDGEWVKYEDIKHLELEHKKFESENKILKETLDSIKNVEVDLNRYECPCCGNAWGCISSCKLNNYRKQRLKEK